MGASARLTSGFHRSPFPPWAIASEARPSPNRGFIEVGIAGKNDGFGYVTLDDRGSVNLHNLSCANQHVP